MVTLPLPLKFPLNTTLRKNWSVDGTRKTSESRINSFPQWTTDVEGLNIHFVGLFSEKKDAVPILLIHGWPGKLCSMKCQE